LSRTPARPRSPPAWPPDRADPLATDVSRRPRAAGGPHPPADARPHLRTRKPPPPHRTQTKAKLPSLARTNLARMGQAPLSAIPQHTTDKAQGDWCLLPSATRRLRLRTPLSLFSSSRCRPGPAATGCLALPHTTSRIAFGVPNYNNINRLLVSGLSPRLAVGPGLRRDDESEERPSVHHLPGGWAAVVAASKACVVTANPAILTLRCGITLCVWGLW
jgi:hypothetical protein